MSIQGGWFGREMTMDYCLTENTFELWTPFFCNELSIRHEMNPTNQPVCFVRTCWNPVFIPNAARRAFCRRSSSTVLITLNAPDVKRNRHDLSSWSQKFQVSQSGKWCSWQHSCRWGCRASACGHHSSRAPPFACSAFQAAACPQMFSCWIPFPHDPPSADGEPFKGGASSSSFMFISACPPCKVE